MFSLTSLTKCLRQQVHFAVNSVCAYVSIRGLNGPLILSKNNLTATKNVVYPFQAQHFLHEHCMTSLLLDNTHSMA